MIAFSVGWFVGVISGGVALIVWAVMKGEPFPPGDPRLERLDGIARDHEGRIRRLEDRSK